VIVKVVASSILALLMVMVMVVGSTQATAYSFQSPLDFTLCILDSHAVPLKTYYNEAQDNFQLLKYTSILMSYCEAIKRIKSFNGPLTGTKLSLALGLPQRCVLNGKFKKG
jgi:hypothetical protein